MLDDLGIVGDVVCPQDADREVTEGGHGVWASAGAYLGAVFVKRQVLGVASLSVQGVRRDNSIGEVVDAVAQGPECGDLLRLARYVDLAEYDTGSIIDRSQQVPRVFLVAGWGPRTVLPSMAITRRVSAGDSVRWAAQPPIAVSSSSPSSRCNTAPEAPTAD